MNLTSNAYLANRTFYKNKEINAVIPEGISKLLSIKVGDRFTFFYGGANFRFRAVHVCSKIPGNFYSIFKVSCLVDLNGSRVN